MRVPTPPLFPPRHIENKPAACRWRKSARHAAYLSAAVAFAALSATTATACLIPEGFARLASPEAEIAYRWQPERLKVGQFFEAEVIACPAPAGREVREVVLDAQMPAHGHGMNYRPTVTALGPGRFRITGLMLHMAGRWRLTFDLVRDDARTRLVREVELRP
ncbi:MAG: hypothetical protein AB7O44_15605 [Hyphomicrobiaceae bacterium]